MLVTGSVKVPTSADLHTGPSSSVVRGPSACDVQAQAPGVIVSHRVLNLATRRYMESAGPAWSGCQRRARQVLVGKLRGDTDERRGDLGGLRNSFAGFA